MEEDTENPQKYKARFEPLYKINGYLIDVYPNRLRDMITKFCDKCFSV